MMPVCASPAYDASETVKQVRPRIKPVRFPKQAYITRRGDAAAGVPLHYKPLTGPAKAGKEIYGNHIR